MAGLMTEAALRILRHRAEEPAIDLIDRRRQPRVAHGNARSITAGEGFTCAVAGGACALCWGGRGHLGSARLLDRPMPTLVTRW